METIGFSTQALVASLASVFPIANLFTELSGYAEVKDIITATQNYFNLVKTPISDKNERD